MLMKRAVRHFKKIELQDYQTYHWDLFLVKWQQNHLSFMYTCLWLRLFFMSIFQDTVVYRKGACTFGSVNLLSYEKQCEATQTFGSKIEIILFDLCTLANLNSVLYTTVFG